MSVTGAVELGELFTVNPPYPAPFSREEQLIIEDAIREGLRRAFLRNPSLGQAPLQEVAITAALEDELASMLEDESEPVPGFTSDVFDLIRGIDLRDYRGDLSVGLENRPDLVFRRKKRPCRGMDFRHFGLFVECKVVDAARVMHPYFQEGLRRITEGRYAWAVSVALMVAYVDGSYQLPQTLTDYMRCLSAGDPLVSEVTLRDAPPAEVIYSTVHVRDFQYADGGAPGPVQVDHLWHCVRRPRPCPAWSVRASVGLSKSTPSSWAAMIFSSHREGEGVSPRSVPTSGAI